MKLNKLELKNFRCFENLNVTFDEKMTVLVAPNGSGKTTILDAIRIVLWPYLNSFDLAYNGFNDPANSITIDDVTKVDMGEDGEARLLPSEIKALGNVLGTVAWSRTRVKESPRSKTLDDQATKTMHQDAKEIQKRVRIPEAAWIELPVLGYYGTGRLWSNKKEKKKVATQTEIDNSSIRTYGYMDCLDPASSYRAFEKWFIKTLNGNTAEIGKIIKRDGRLSVTYETKYSDRICVVQNALDTVLSSTDYQKIDLDIDSQKLSMFNKKMMIDLKVEQLSDGIRNMIGMVADIAYRCYQLNPHLGVNAALESKGIILIDEVDMHLHPHWQQLILRQLQEAFPNLQFIVTTHSPQVLTTVNRENIRVLKQNDNGFFFVEKPDLETIGVESQVTLNDLMGVNPIPPVEEALWLNDYIAMIENGTHEQEGEALRSKLLAKYGEQHPLIRDFERLIRFQNFKHQKNKMK